MRRLFGRLLLLGALAGAVVAVRSYLKEAPGEETVQIVFGDGSTHALASDSTEAREFTDIARKVLEIGV